MDAPTRPATEPGRRRWWSPAPAPDLDELAPVTARRAYVEVLFVFAAFFLTGIVGAALLLAGRYQNLLQSGSWAIYGTQAVDVCMQIALAVVVVLLLSARRGVGAGQLGLRVPRLDDGRLAVSQTVRIVAWALVGLIAGGIVNGIIQSGHLPTGPPTAPELVFGMVDSVQAGVIEELVVLAFVVVTLRQARRPLWEITLVALVLRGSYHIYYGPGVVGILLWAAIYYWTYLRFRQLVPLMVCHALWDVVGFLSQRWPAVTGVAVLVVVVIWIVAPILWLVERNNRVLVGPAGGRGGHWPPGTWPAGGWPAGEWRPGAWPEGGWPSGGWPPGGRAAGSPPGGLTAPGAGPPPDGAGPPRDGAGLPRDGAGNGRRPPPGWHPDPAGHNRWRWWDGERWTEHVSSHG